MVTPFFACLVILSCGINAAYGDASGEKFSRKSNRGLLIQSFNSNSFGNDPFGNSFTSSSFGQGSKGVGSFGSKFFDDFENQFNDVQKGKLQRKPSLMGSSTLQPGGVTSTVTYLINGKPVTKEEFEAAKAKRPTTTTPTPGTIKKPGTTSPAAQRKTGVVSLTEEVKQRIVALHNKYREQLATGKVPGQPKATAMTKMIWDEQLSEVAGKWSAGCRFVHSNTEQYCGISNLPSVGENLGTGTLRSDESVATPEEAATKILTHIENWFNEHVDYHFNSLKCNVGKKCGHYTQVVSDKSDRVGCAVAVCNGVAGFVSSPAYLVTCNYGPAGNVYGEKPYETSGQTCPWRRPLREGNFCVGEGTYAQSLKSCEDTSPGCPKWLREGKCEMCNNPYYDSVTSQCPKTCGLCR